MVIDNIDRDWQGKTKDDQAYDYHEFLPHANHGNVLITTRLRRLQRPNASLHLDAANDQLAKEMVETRANKVVTSTCVRQRRPRIAIANVTNTQTSINCCRSSAVCRSRSLKPEHISARPG